MLIFVWLPLLCNCKCHITSYITLSGISQNSLNWCSHPISLIHYIWHSRARGLTLLTMFKVIVLLTTDWRPNVHLIMRICIPYYQCLSFDLVMHLHNPNPYRVNIVPEIVAHDRSPCFVHRFTYSTIIYKSDSYILAYIVKYKEKKSLRKKLDCCALTQTRLLCKYATEMRGTSPSLNL